MNAEKPLPAPDYEKTDASPRTVALIAFSLGAIVAVGLGTAGWLYRSHWRSDQATKVPVAQDLFQHGVDDETAVARAWREQDRLVHEHLETYGWVDRAAGVVHVPITRAMELMLAGARPPATPGTPARSQP